MKLTLENLPTQFLESRSDASSSAKYCTSDVPPDTCRYCGRAWRSALPNTNDGHARCIVTRAFVAAVAELWWATPTLTRLEIARICGVSPGTAHAWTNPRNRSPVRSATARIEVAR